MFYVVLLYVYNFYFKIVYYIVFFLGIDILNNVIESVYSRIFLEKWMFVDVVIVFFIFIIIERGVNIVIFRFFKV